MWAALMLVCHTGQIFKIVKAENPVWPAGGDFYVRPFVQAHSTDSNPRVC